MKGEELKTKTEDELKKMLLDLRKEQFNLRFQRTGGTLENTAILRRTRRDIARIKTFLNVKTADVKPTAEKAPAKKAPAKKKTTAKTKAA